MCITVKSVRKVFRENNIEAVLQRLERVTQDEARITAVQILEVLYNLVRNLTVVMNGEPIQLYIYHASNIVRSRWQSIRSWRLGTSRCVSFAATWSRV
jgi:hypothetical protein